MSSPPRICVIVGRQRSGTTALTETVALGLGCRSYGEVFHHVQCPGDGSAARRYRLDEGANFFDFKMELLAERPDLAYPSVANQDEIYAVFLDFLARKDGQRWIVLDVKYNSWLHFEEVYSNVGGVPRLFDLLVASGAVFIHLVRRSAFSRYCSEQLALARDRWHAVQGETVEAASIEIDSVDAMRDMKETRRQTEVFNRMLFRAPRHLDLAYEDTFAGDHLSEATERRIAGFLQDTWAPRVTVPLSKLLPSLSRVVRNRTEVIAYFRDTSFQDDVESALGDR